jgi:hypothetical protein
MLIIFLILLLVIPIFSWYYIDFKYVKNLENKKCNCSNIWERDILKYLSLVDTIIIYIITILPIVFSKKTKIINANNISKFGNILLGFSTYIYLSFFYKTHNCECSRSWRRSFLLFRGLFGIYALYSSFL